MDFTSHGCTRKSANQRIRNSPTLWPKMIKKEKERRTHQPRLFSKTKKKVELTSPGSPHSQSPSLPFSPSMSIRLKKLNVNKAEKNSMSIRLKKLNVNQVGKYINQAENVQYEL